MKHLKEDVAAQYKWAAERWPDNVDGEVGLTYLLHRLEGLLDEIDKTITNLHQTDEDYTI